MNKVIAYLESGESNLVYGIGLVVATLVCDLVRSITFTMTQVFGQQTGWDSIISCIFVFFFNNYRVHTDITITSRNVKCI